MPASGVASTKPSLRGNGQSLVELALVMPVLIMVLSIALDFSRVFYYSVSLTSAAREGARYGAAQPGDTPGIVGRVVGEPAGSVTLDPGLVVVSADADSVRVTVSHTVGAFTPLVSRVWNGTVSATVEMPVLAGGG